MNSTKSISLEPNSPMDSISAALKATESKKENLHKAFQNLKSHSSFLSSFNLNWEDIENHFNSTQKSIEERFKELLERENQSNKQPLIKSGSKPNEVVVVESKTFNDLKSLCIKMDGIHFLSYVMDHRKQYPSIRDEIPIAFKFAIDPAKLILDSMKVFYPKEPKDVRGGEVGASRRTCNMLLEILISTCPKISPLVREEAKGMAFEWKSKLSSGSSLESFAFLQLLATYSLASEFDVNELLDLLVSVVRRKQAFDWFKLLGLMDKIPDFIGKLTSQNKHLDAVKFIYEFKLVDKYPPVPLLKAHLQETKKIVDEILRKGNNSLQAQNDANAKEIGSLKVVIKCIEDYKLESQYPQEILLKRIEQLEREKKNRKRAAEAVITSRSDQHQQQNRKKHVRPALNTNTIPTSAASSSQNYLPSMGNLPGQVAPYLRSSTHYGLAGAFPSAPEYLNPAVAQTGFRSIQDYPNIGGNPNSSRSDVYSFEAQIASGTHGRQNPGGLGLLSLYPPPFYQ